MCDWKNRNKWILDMTEQVFYRDLINRRSPFQETPAGEKETPAGEKETPAGEKKKTIPRIFTN